MYIKILLKLLAIAYICQIASNLCEDLGYHSISFQIETIGKLSILVSEYSNYQFLEPKTI